MLPRRKHRKCVKTLDISRHDIIVNLQLPRQLSLSNRWWGGGVITFITYCEIPEMSSSLLWEINCRIWWNLAWSSKAGVIFWQQRLCVYLLQKTVAEGFCFGSWLWFLDYEFLFPCLLVLQLICLLCFWLTTATSICTSYFKVVGFLFFKINTLKFAKPIFTCTAWLFKDGHSL